MKAVVLLSGGLDSVTALHLVAREHEVVGALSFDYGSKHNARELPMAAWQAGALRIPHEVIGLDFMDRCFSSALLASGGAIPDGHYEEESMKRTVVPFRNGIMLSVAAGYAESRGASAVVVAAHGGDHAVYPDCRGEFMAAMADAMRLGTYAEVDLLRPFIATDKAGIVRVGVYLGVDYGRTWSCYKGGDVHCGRCGTCVERREAFMLAGVNDPTEYAWSGPLPERKS